MWLGWESEKCCNFKFNFKFKSNLIRLMIHNVNDIHLYTHASFIFAQVDLFNFGADLIFFVEQFNEILLYLTEL